jgi:hypothetical protein
MGVYLSTPNTELHSEIGQGYGLEYAVGEIQVRSCLRGNFSLVLNLVFCLIGLEKAYGRCSYL